MVPLCGNILVRGLLMEARTPPSSPPRHVVSISTSIFFVYLSRARSPPGVCLFFVSFLLGIKSMHYLYILIYVLKLLCFYVFQQICFWNRTSSYMCYIPFCTDLNSDKLDNMKIKLLNAGRSYLLRIHRNIFKMIVHKFN